MSDRSELPFIAKQLVEEESTDIPVLMGLSVCKQRQDFIEFLRYNLRFKKSIIKC